MKSIKEILPALVYGGSDGAITTFSVMAGAAGAGLSPRIIIILGCANLASDGFSMASADYLSEESRDTPTRRKSFIQAIATFISFVGVGLIPLIPFLLALCVTLPTNEFLLSVIFTFVAFASIGYIRGVILKQNRLSTVFQSVGIGTLCAGVAYIVGQMAATIVR